MLRALVVIFALALAGSAFSHEDSKWTKGPQGGHIVDAVKGKQHWSSSPRVVAHALRTRRQREADQRRRR
jgi:hypothetical protein